MGSHILAHSNSFLNDNHNNNHKPDWKLQNGIFICYERKEEEKKIRKR